MTAALTLLALALAPLADLTEEDARPAQIARLESQVRLSAPRTQVAIVQQGDGIWARGRSYKARASTDGFTFIPFLGSKASKNWPVRFELIEATLNGEPLPLGAGAPRVSHDEGAFCIRRGAVEARYELALDAVEQTFRVAGAAGQTGDLVLDLAVTTELEAQPKGTAWTLEGPEGAVNFGAAAVLDSTGRRQPIEARFEAGSLRFTVPGSFLARAEGPVVIDPLISTQVLDSYFLELTRPDVAYEDGSDTYLVAYEESFSSTDGDVYSRTFDAQTLALVEEEYVDVTGSRTYQPKVASHAGDDSYLVVCMQEDSLGLVSLIGRVQVTGAAGGWEPPFVVAGPDEFYERVDHDVAGVAMAGAGSLGYVVVWERRVRGGVPLPSVIEGRRLTGLGSPIDGYFFVSETDPSRSHSRPSISKFAGRFSPIAVYVAWASGPSVGSRDQLHTRRIAPFAFLDSVQNVVQFPHPVDDVEAIDISSPNEDSALGPIISMAVQLRDGPLIKSYFVSGRMFSATGLFFSQVIERSPLVDLGSAGTRRAPILATFARRNACAYYDGFLGQPAEVRLSSFRWVAGERHAVGERRTLLATLNGPEKVAGGAATEYSSNQLNSTRGLFTWQDESVPGSDQDIFGSIVDLNAPPAIGGVVTCNATRNSSGDFGFLAAYGDNSITTSKILRASSLPQNSVGYFLASPSSGGGTIPPASSGSLCLSGSIGRYAQLPQDSGNGGRFEITVDPAAIVQPMGTVQVQMGSTWFFQAWHRDVGQGPTSNFTNAVAIQF